MTDEELRRKIKRYTWYHQIEVRPGIFTADGPAFPKHWAFIRGGLNEMDFTGKTVLDVGCRDGMFAFEVERKGAKQVVAIDNNLSRGAVDVLIPELKSNVEMIEASIYDFTHEAFDIVLFLGVLYHLRYPFNGLRCAVNLLKDGGMMVIETAVYKSGQDWIPLVYCPFKDGPYEPSSVSFFNEAAMKCTMESMGCPVKRYVESDIDTVAADGSRVKRAWFECVKTGAVEKDLQTYWGGIHNLHTR